MKREWKDLGDGEKEKVEGYVLFLQVVTKK